MKRRNFIAGLLGLFLFPFVKKKKQKELPFSGENDTGWKSDNPYQWIKYDFGSNHKIRRVRITSTGEVFHPVYPPTILL